jgi:hypothetical protein
MMAIKHTGETNTYIKNAEANMDIVRSILVNTTVMDIA